MKIIAGLSFKETFSLSDYDADDGWSLRGYITNASSAIELADSLFTGDGTSWELNIPKATTAGYTAGTYQIQLIAFDGTDDYVAAEYKITIEATAAAARETRSANRIILDNLNTVLATKSTQDHSSLSIEGRSITRMSWDEILTARDKFQQLVNAEERAAAGAARVRNIQVRF